MLLGFMDLYKQDPVDRYIRLLPRHRVAVAYRSRIHF
jgi:hypothetical protein